MGTYHLCHELGRRILLQNVEKRRPVLPRQSVVLNSELVQRRSTEVQASLISKFC